MSVLGLRSITNTMLSAGDHERPSLPRRETDQILSYYQSEDAGRTYAASENEGMSSILDDRSSSSTSGSTSSSKSKGVSTKSTGRKPTLRETQALPSPQSSEPQRRRSARSTGGADKRRVAIVETGAMRSYEDEKRKVEVSPTAEAQSTYNSALLSKRGVDSSRMAGLALVAPSDASPSAYTDLTPPPTSAPAISGRDSFSAAFHDVNGSSSGRHQRSASEAIKPGPSRSMSRKASRDVGIVGTIIGSRVSEAIDSQSGVPSNNDCQPRADGLSPIFQTPRSTTYSPIPPPTDSIPNTPADEQRPSLNGLSMSRRSSAEPSPSVFHIGETKNVHDPVEGPVVVNLTSNQMWQTPSATSVVMLNSPVSDYSSPTLATSLSVQSSSTVPASYLHYQPGVHATAGPLPPPPRHILPPSTNSPRPPRPPRLHSPQRSATRAPDNNSISSALMLPDSISRILPKQSSASSLKSGHTGLPTSAVSTASDEQRNQHNTLPAVSLADAQREELPKATHVREGAFPATSVFITHAVPSSTPSSQDVETYSQKRKETMDDLVAVVGDAIDEVGLMKSSDTAPPTVLEPPRDHPDNLMTERPPVLDLRRESSWVSLGDEFRERERPSSDEGHRDSLDSLRSPSTHSASHLTTQVNGVIDRRTPSPQKLGLDYALKRFSSLPRTPSLLSAKRLSRRTSNSKSPSPSRSYAVLPNKTRSLWPDAMNFNEVQATKSALDRALGYAHKINELSTYDCGLGDWVMLTKQKSVNPREAGNRMSVSVSAPAVPPGRMLTSKARHVSHGSMASEATFPRRADAYIATDLSSRTSDDGTPPDAPPPLPYPSLAQGARVPLSRTFGGISPPSSTRSVPSTLSSSKSIGGGFFASIGRKASMKRERSGPTSPSYGAKLLSHRSPTELPMPRTVKISSAPSVPGGPRAIPGRAQRTQSVLATSHASKPTSQPSPPAEAVRSQDEVSRRASMKRRPSLFHLSRPIVDEADNPAFDKQVDKLADLLPHADKPVLAGYLRRSGQDILAIGQYLEDERNGTIRLD